MIDVAYATARPSSCALTSGEWLGKRFSLRLQIKHHKN